MTDINNGLLTKIWGPPLWETFHAVTFGYPVNPDNDKKDQYRTWLIGLGNVLPCVYCRKSYCEFITDGDTALTDNDLISRENLCKWGYRMHNKVNEKLEIDYGTTYSDLENKYESYRAKCVHKDKGCTMPIDLKAESYKKADIIQAPIVPYDFCKKLTGYAKFRGLVRYKKNLNHYNKKLIVGDRTDRDKECIKLIKYMRNKSIDCTEDSGEFAGLPTLHELALLSKRSGNVNTTKQSEIIAVLKKWTDLHNIK